MARILEGLRGFLGGVRFCDQSANFGLGDRAVPIQAHAADLLMPLGVSAWPVKGGGAEHGAAARREADGVVETGHRPGSNAAAVVAPGDLEPSGIHGWISLGEMGGQQVGQQQEGGGGVEAAGDQSEEHGGSCAVPSALAMASRMASIVSPI